MSNAHERLEKVTLQERYVVDLVRVIGSSEPDYKIWNNFRRDYVSSTVPGSDWVHWIKEIADEHCANLNAGRV